MKLCVWIFGFLMVFCVCASACTTFFINKNGQMVFGRNLDWVTGIGSVNTNLRGATKTSLQLEKGNPLRWTSKFGSITFNQYGKEFPNGGMNETGLVVEIMWLNESSYPAPDQRPGFSVLQWVQYQLDNCATVDEVIATDKKIRITSTNTPQHYLIADSKGGVATIEFLNGKMVVHKGKGLPYPVLANNTYAESAEAVKAKGNSENSISRFTTACNMVQQYQQVNTNKSPVDYSFDILNKVAQGDFTKWSIVYDISNKKIYFKTSGYIQVKNVAFSNFDFSCTAKALSFNMNQAVTGNVNKHFVNYSNQQNKQQVKEAFSNSKSEVTIPEALQNAMAELAAAVKCG